MTLAIPDAEAILRSRLGEPAKSPTDYVVGFTTPSGKVLAIHREASQTRVWFQPPEPPKLEGVRLMDSPSNGNSNISGPLLRLRAPTTLRVEVDSRSALNRFLDWYMGSALRIDYVSRDFPASYTFRSGTLSTSWDELLWAAITLGRPSTYHVFRYGQASFHEAIFRLALVRMAVEQDRNGYLRRTNAFAALDPTEKGMVSYFLGMTLCKVFASRLLVTPWLLHLDVFRSVLNPVTLGRSRPDLVGEDANGNWYAFESKGRSSVPSQGDKAKAKAQAQRLVSVKGINCSLQIGSLAFFKSEMLEFYWRDPEPDSSDTIELPGPEVEWRYYYEPALSLAADADSEPMAAERELADIRVEIHPKIRHLLQNGEWSQAKQSANEQRHALISEGYQPDGIKLTAGASWTKPFEPSERGGR
jgi:hypothetical protein